jgi:hypothetical protein
VKTAARNRPIGIGIVTFNNLPLLKRCFPSWRASRRGRLVIFDNGSAPEVVAWLRRQRIERLILAAANRGVWFARNRILECFRDRAEVEFVLLADSDVLFHDGMIEEMENRMRSDPQLGFVGYPQANRSFPVSPEGYVEELAGECQLTRMEMWREIGLFPENLEYYSADSWKSTIANMHGWRTAVVEGRQGYHHFQHGSHVNPGVREAMQRDVAQWARKETEFVRYWTRRLFVGKGNQHMRLTPDAGPRPPVAFPPPWNRSMTTHPAHLLGVWGIREAEAFRFPLLKYWFRHYADCGIRPHAMHIAILTDNLDYAEPCRVWLHDFGVEDVRIKESAQFDFFEVTRERQELQSGIEPDDWFVNPDMDELIAFSDSVPNLVAWLTRHDFNHIVGDLRDRFARDYRLPEIVDDLPLHLQFPLEFDFTHGALGACPRKVVLALNRFRIELGCHQLSNSSPVPFKYSPLLLPIDHYKWDAGLKLRCERLRAYVRKFPDDQVGWKSEYDILLDCIEGDRINVFKYRNKQLVEPVLVPPSTP